MKCRLGQVLKRVTAIGMAVWMIFLPLNVKISKVYGGQASTDINNVVRIEYDSYFSVVVKDGVTEIPGRAEGTADNPAMVYDNLTKGNIYNISFKLIDDLNAEVSNLEIVNANSQVVEDTFKVTEEMLENDESVADISYKVRLKGDILFSISGTGCENISAKVGNTVLEMDKTGKYVLEGGPYLTDSVDITFQTGMDQKVDSVGVQYMGITESKRNYKLSVSVKDILVSKAITILTSKVKTYNVTADNGTVSIPASHKVASSNQYYEPTENETVEITVTPNDGYKISSVVLEKFENGKDFILSGEQVSDKKFQIEVSAKKRGNITVIMEMLGPEGTFIINNFYGAKDAEITYTKPKNMKTGFVLQYAILPNNNRPNSTTNWIGLPSITGSQYTLTVPYDEKHPSKNIYVRYSNADGTSISEPQVSDEIKFDGYAPEITEIQLNLNGTPYTAKYNWGNADPLILPYYYFNNGEDIYMSGIDANNEIRVYANDDQGKYQSGLQQQLTTGTGIGTLSKNGPYYTILFGPKDKTDQMNITFSDQAGNSLSTQIKLDNILLDLTPPTAEVEFSRKGAEVDIEKWQIDAVTVKVTPDDQVPSENPNNEVASGVKSVKIFENGKSIGSMDSTTKVCTATVKDHGVHDLEIVVTDNAGNEFRQPRTIRIDKRGIINTVINFESENNNFYNDCIISAGAESLSGIQEIRFQFLEQGSVVREYIPASIDKGAANFLYTRDMGNFNGIVKVTFADYAGNTKTIERSFAFNQDGASLTVSGDSDWTSGSVFVSAAASDPITKIKKIEYYVDGVLAEKVELEEHTSYTGGITISDTVASHLGTQVEVVVTSASGKETHGYAVVRVDKQVPSISLSGITEGSIYNTTRSLEITTVENIWQAMQPVSVTAVRTIDGTSTHLDLGSVEADGATTLSAYSFSEDGVYQVTIQAVDAAGNSAVKTISFTIDRTLTPMMSRLMWSGSWQALPLGEQSTFRIPERPPV